MSKHKKDIIAGVVLLLVCIAYFAMTSGIKVFAGVGAPPISARDMPRIWSVVLGVLAIALLVRGIVSDRREKTEKGEKSGTIEDWIKDNYAVLGSFVALFLYALLMKKVGFLICTAAYLPIQIQLLADKEKRGKRNYIMTAVISVMFTVLSYVVFFKLLNVPLPRGILAF